MHTSIQLGLHGMISLCTEGAIESVKQLEKHYKSAGATVSRLCDLRFVPECRPTEIKISQ